MKPFVQPRHLPERGRAFLGLLVCSLLAACGPQGAQQVVLDLGGNSFLDESVGAEHRPGDVLPGDWGTDAGDAWGPEALGEGRDGDIPVEEILPGEFGWDCTSNGQCTSGYCVETADGKKCTVTCSDECPLDWACVQDQTAAPDLVYICLPPGVRLCMPCTKHEECSPPGTDTGARYMDFGSVGGYCGAACGDDLPCPAGYTCDKEAPLEGAGTSPQCRSKDWTCECTGLAVTLGATTDCEVTNEWGTCGGQTRCLQVGPAECDAPAPAEEVCDGIDDDCDGGVDEDLGETTCGIGSCLHTVANCPDGKPVDCDPMEGSTAEKCNGEDDDCDGTTDEDFEDMNLDGIADYMTEPARATATTSTRKSTPGPIRSATTASTRTVIWRRRNRSWWATLSRRSSARISTRRP